MICKNCGYDFEGNYCNNCGQKAKTVRLDWHYLSDEAKYTFLHFNGGLFYTTKALLKRPGHSIREFLEGKRVHHYKPVLLVFVLAGIYGFLIHYIDSEKTLDVFGQQPASDDENLKASKGIEEWIRSHYSIIEVLTIPYLSFFSWLVFRRWGYNFVEHIIINTFCSAQRLMIMLGAFPFLFLLQGTFWYLPVQFFFSIISYIATAVSYSQVYKEKDLGMVILKVLLFGVLAFIPLVILVFTIIVAFLVRQN